jgi:hypothetical protein
MALFTGRKPFSDISRNQQDTFLYDRKNFIQL